MAQSLTITSPKNGSVVKGKITATVNSTSVRTCNFFLDGKSIGSDSTLPFSLVIDTTKLINGSHTLKVSSDNKKANSSVTFSVSNILSSLAAKFAYKKV